MCSKEWEESVTRFPLAFARKWLKEHAQVEPVDVWDPMIPRAQLGTLQMKIRLSTHVAEKVLLKSGRDGVSIWELGQGGRPPQTKPVWFKEEQEVSRQEA